MRRTITILQALAIVSFGAFAQSSAIPSISPVTGFSSTDINRPFGNVMHPALKVERKHRGVDFPAPDGTSVVATADGVVLSTGQNSADGFFVVIKHANGYRTKYTHLSKIVARRGNRVTQGTTIAYSGSTGLSSGPHLHYEVIHNGEYQDPADFFAAKE